MLLVTHWWAQVLEEEEYLRRKEYYQESGQRHYYFMNIGNGEVIDAARKVNRQTLHCSCLRCRYSLSLLIILAPCKSSGRGRGTVLTPSGVGVADSLCNTCAGSARAVHKPLLQSQLRDAEVGGARRAGHRPVCAQGHPCWSGAHL